MSQEQAQQLIEQNKRLIEQNNTLIQMLFAQFGAPDGIKPSMLNKLIDLNNKKMQKNGEAL